MPSDNVYATLYNADVVALSNGMLLRISANQRAVRAQADSAPHVQGLAGINGSGIIGIGGPVNVVGAAVRQPVLCETGLTISAGQTLYVSGTVPGRATNVAPALAIAIGTVEDVGTYAQDARVYAALDIPASTTGGGGVFPGFGTAPPAIGPTSAGVSGLASYSDHTHPWRHVADQAALDLLDASTMLDGQPVYVDTYKDFFDLTASTQAVAANVRRTALGKAGYLWIRRGYSPGWWNQTTWHINPATGNDENTGLTSLLPLATFAEYRRRHFMRWLPGTETGSVTVNIAGGDLPVGDYVSAVWANGLRGGDQVLTVQGTATVVASGTIVAGGFNAVNRATGQRNTIGAGFSWAAHVGRQVRLVATPTTVATIMEDLGGNVCALSEQSVNGVIGAGFTVGQAIEVVTYTAIPGLNVGSGAPSSVTLNNIDCDGRGAAFNCRHSGGASSQITSLNSRFIGVTGGTINVANFRPFGTSFVGPGTITINAAWFGDLTTSVGMPAGGLLLINPFDRNHIASHMSQGPAFTVGENCYANISGTGSGFIGIFGLASGAFGMTINIGAHLSCSNMWGSGNDALSIAIRKHVAGSWSKVGDGATNFNTIGTAGMYMGRGVPSGEVIIPLAQLPSAIGNGQQPGASVKFTGKISFEDAVPSASYMADSGAEVALAVLVGTTLGPQRYASSERLCLRLRATQLQGPIPTPITVTLYISGVATAMTLTIPSTTAQFAKFVDSAHPLLIPEDGDYDVRLDEPGGSGGSGDALVSAQLEFAT